MLGFGKNKQSSTEKTTAEAQNKNKGQEIGIRLPQVRKNDEVYVIKK